MKVENITPIKKVEKKNYSKNSSDFSLNIDNEVAAKSTPIISNISELFSIYNINLQNQTEQAKIYGGNLLDSLEKLKLSLLTGKYSKNDLVEIEKILCNKDEYQDFALGEIITEIELRVHVELAKMDIK